LDDIVAEAIKQRYITLGENGTARWPRNKQGMSLEKFVGPRAAIPRVLA